MVYEAARFGDSNQLAQVLGRPEIVLAKDLRLVVVVPILRQLAVGEVVGRARAGTAGRLMDQQVPGVVVRKAMKSLVRVIDLDAPSSPVEAEPLLEPIWIHTPQQSPCRIVRVRRRENLLGRRSFVQNDPTTAIENGR